MRIISGTHKGRTFQVSKAFKSRPTTDIARESLFNVIAHQYRINGLVVVDLFSGSGAISYEFASRGAAQVLSIEKSYPVCKQIMKNAKDLGLEVIKVLRKDVFKWLSTSDHKADIIFADPPFDMKGLETLPDLVIENGFLNEGGCFILEHGRDHDFSEHKHFEELKQYGSVHFSFFFVD